jgi:phosphoserine phosphatase
MTTPRVDAQGVIDRLLFARVPEPSGLAFDADGTLWAGDVGEDVFDFACRHELLRDEPLEHLQRVARAHGLADTGSPSALAGSLYAAYRSGILPELLTCEIMTWSYAGWTLDELGATAARALRERGLVDRVRRVLTPIFEFARREDLATIVVSASPHPVVIEALRLAELEFDEVAAARPALSGGRIQPVMAAKVPYGPEKPVFGAQLLGTRDWLGSFGDNAFDVEMLRAARIGVAVCPKPALVLRLPELVNTVVLE